MSALASASAFVFKAGPQSHFPPQAAFKKPNMVKRHKQTYGDCSELPNSRLSTVFENKPARQLAASRYEGADISISQPTKKVKVNHLGSYSKVQENKCKPSKLTIEEVFNTPTESKKSCTGSFMIEESADEGSSLSFISSCTSLDSLDEVTIIEENKTNACITSNEPLAVKDDIMSNLNKLLSGHLLNMNQPSVFQPTEFLQTLEWEEQNLLGNNNQSLTYIDPINLPLTQLNEYVQFGTYDHAEFNLFAKNIPEINVLEAQVKNTSDFRDEEYCSDFYATRSTDIGETLSSDNSLKGSSPIYRGNFEVYEKKAEHNKHKGKAAKSHKQGKNPTKANKDKPKRHQLALERENSCKTSASTVTDQSENQEIKDFMMPVEIRLPHSSETVMPACNRQGSRRSNFEPKWNPESMETQDVEEYFQRLCNVLGMVSDQEAALKLLKSFGMNVSLTLEIVEQNQSFYKEMFRVKVKRLRRNGM